MFQEWLHPPREFQETNDGLLIGAPGNTDFFIDPISGKQSHNAPLYFLNANGDFTLEAEVRPDFQAMYDAGALMLYADPLNWIKFAFERTDAGHDGVVSVVTRSASDDANGAAVRAPAVRLKLSRCDSLVGMYCMAADRWQMVRLCRFPTPAGAPTRVGLVAQSPAGQGCRVEFRELKFSETPVVDFRKGV